jgi:hypothetical protein
MRANFNSVTAIGVIAIVVVTVILVIAIGVGSQMVLAFVELSIVVALLKLKEVSSIPAGCKLLTRISSRWVFNASLSGNDAEQAHLLASSSSMLSKAKRLQRQGNRFNERFNRHFVSPTPRSGSSAPPGSRLQAPGTRHEVKDINEPRKGHQSSKFIDITSPTNTFNISHHEICNQKYLSRLESTPIPTLHLIESKVWLCAKPAGIKASKASHALLAVMNRRKTNEQCLLGEDI